MASAIAAFVPASAVHANVGDLDGDGDTDIRDFASLVACLAGPSEAIPAGCDTSDLNTDLHVDLRDVAAFQIAFAPPTGILSTSPTNGERDVALTRETIITVRGTVDAATVSGNDVFASFGGEKIPALLRVTPDGKRIKLFYNSPLPASARVRVTVDGTNINDGFGNALDADGDGVPGGIATFDFDTCSTTRIPNTNVFGYVFASERQGPGGENVPIGGVTIRADGMPELFAVTDENGFFQLQNTPAPLFFVHVDGTTATSVGGGAIPGGGFYPNVGKPFHSSAGHTVQISMDNEPFDIFLPLIADNSLVSLIPDQPTEIGLSPEGKARLAELFPDLDPASFDALRLTIPANSLTNDDGTPGGMAGIFPVDSTRLPAPLGDGTVHAFDITIQTDGASNFDILAQICFPNVPDPVTGEVLPPGGKTGLVSFNHDTGRWEFRGLMTVSEDGTVVCPDEGVGIAAPWLAWKFRPPGGPPAAL
ncbi:MAG: Ig-like domain-containing protein [Planctomycetes bacterium]|nr:Ig-like domain-containing protein [Planctomycetota bacterium]